MDKPELEDGLKPSFEGLEGDNTSFDRSSHLPRTASIPFPVDELTVEDEVDDDVNDGFRGENRVGSFAEVHDGDGGTSASRDRTSHLPLTASMRLGVEGVAGRSFILLSSCIGSPRAVWWSVLVDAAL